MTDRAPRTPAKAPNKATRAAVKKTTATAAKKAPVRKATKATRAAKAPAAATPAIVVEAEALLHTDASTARAHRAHVQRVHEAEGLVDTLETSRSELRDKGRETMGVSEKAEKVPFRTAMRDANASIYPLVALGLLGLADQFQSLAFGVLAPDMARALGLSIGLVTGVRTLAFLAQTLAPLPVARITQSKARRAAVCIITGVLWSIITLTTGFVVNILALIGVLVADGLSTGSVSALHSPLLVDSYPPTVRARALTGYQGIVTFGGVASPLLVALLTGPFNLTWRGVFLGLGLISTVASLISIGLRDPGFGKYDTEQLRAEVRSAHGADRDESGVYIRNDLAEAEVELGFFEICRRVLLIPTVRRLSLGWMAIGILVIPFGTFLSFYLDERWNLGSSGRGVFFAATAGASVAVLLLIGPRVEKAFRANPGGVIGFSGLSLLGALVAIGLGVLAPNLALVYVCFIAAGAGIAIMTPALTLVMLSIVEARWRPHTAAMIGIFTAAGSIIGVLFLGGIDRRFGTGGALVSLMIPGIIGSLLIRSSRTTVIDDMDRMIDTIIEDEEIRQIEASGGRLPMLACRGIDFSYGQLQVLFDVNFTVDDGEMVALLGTNGAGKSTLLKVISGIGLPSQGSVRFRGQDITYLDAERRVTMGITQIPGGRAVFGPMNVVENLRAFGYTFGADRKKVETLIERCLTAFPRLEERKGSLASTLSGGEQQMLGLSKALMLRPRLLVIDELSLGLAPVIVGQLLEMVREINNEGTAVVLVEQSVNIALSLVDHAYFMEKGEMRFDGTSEDLLGRGDLLRAVFLEGADSNAGASA